MFSTRKTVVVLGFAAWLIALPIAGGGSVAAAESFVRGDVDASGQLEVTDAIRVLGLLFLGAPETVHCQKAADADDSGRLDVSDVIRILTYLFQRGPVPPGPFPFCGEDPTEDELGCVEYGTCVPVHDVFGIQIAAEGVFFVIDASGTQAATGALALAKQETEKVILAFPEKIQLGVFFFDSGLTKFPSSGVPAEANPGIKDSVVAWIHSNGPGSGSCPLSALASALRMAAQASVRRKVILYMTDGGGTCVGGDEGLYLQDTLKAVAAQNWQHVRIYSLQMGAAGPTSIKYLRDLAAQNGGEFHVIPLR